MNVQYKNLLYALVFIPYSIVIFQSDLYPLYLTVQTMLDKTHIQNEY